MTHGRLTRRTAGAIASAVVASTCAVAVALSLGAASDWKGASDGEGASDAAVRSAAAQQTAAPTSAPLATIITPVAVPPEEPSAVLAASAPVRLTIAAIGVDTQLMDLGLNVDGTLEVPPDGTLAGWFTGAPTPGERGPAVIAGHVDWIGPAVFHDLGTLVPGDVIDVTRADGSVAVFAVTEVGQYPKSAFPTEAVYGAVEVAALRLITCGGVFDDSIGHYDDNVVVFAELVQAS